MMMNPLGKESTGKGERAYSIRSCSTRIPLSLVDGALFQSPSASSSSSGTAAKSEKKSATSIGQFSLSNATRDILEVLKDLNLPLSESSSTKRKKSHPRRASESKDLTTRRSLGKLYSTMPVLKPERKMSGDDLMDQSSSHSNTDGTVSKNTKNALFSNVQEYASRKANMFANFQMTPMTQQTWSVFPVSPKPTKKSVTSSSPLKQQVSPSRIPAASSSPSDSPRQLSPKGISSMPLVKPLRRASMDTSQWTSPKSMGRPTPDQTTLVHRAMEDEATPTRTVVTGSSSTDGQPCKKEKNPLQETGVLTMPLRKASIDDTYYPRLQQPQQQRRQTVIVVESPSVSPFVSPLGQRRKLYSKPAFQASLSSKNLSPSQILLHKPERRASIETTFVSSFYSTSNHHRQEYIEEEKSCD